MQPNRLAQETSPYLKQHESNPVDWYAWGPEALERARRENKPIFLSVGYSSCHWCHVMAHESFESADVAEVLNREFISIKVDREERPDLDQIYQNVAQAMTGGGGWPLSVFLTPDLKPFYGGTYFPPEDRYGRPGFKRLVTALGQAYRENRATVDENAEKLTSIVHQLEKVDLPQAALAGEKPDLRQAAEKLLSGIDWTNGGIGGAPKFPNTGIFAFLWRFGLGLPEKDALRERCLAAVVLTLTKMCRGGIYDQLGGGFHRYSVDEFWSVPHFEKMLYDNALLIQLLTEVLATDRLFGEKILQSQVRETLQEALVGSVRYVLREMRAPEGAFYAAQDADSEGEEGKFFVWKPEDLRALVQSGGITEEESRIFALRFGVDESGNFEHGAITGATVLFQARSIQEIAAQTDVGKEERVRSILASASEKLFRAREKRIKPGLDDKTLTSWSALMISALSFAAAYFRGGDESRKLGDECARAATEAYAALRDRAWADGKLHATLQKGKPRFDAYLDDYAFLARAALDLGRVDPVASSTAQKFSRELLKRVLSEFGDPQSVGYYFTSEGHEALLARPKSIYDQAIPSGTAVTLDLIAAHQELTEDLSILDRLRVEWDRQSPTLFAAAIANPFGHGELLCSALMAERGRILLESPNGTGQLVRYLLAAPEVLPKEGLPVPQGRKSPDQVLWCARRTCREVETAHLEEAYRQHLHRDP